MTALLLDWCARNAIITHLQLSSFEGILLPVVALHQVAPGQNDLSEKQMTCLLTGLSL